MGLSSKQVTGDEALDWAAPEMSKPPPSRRQQPPQRQPEPLKCPRCASINTKFCYYNNYNKSQPRHFCKSCKRHWTKGGTLRNVPVGGGRKNKRPKIPSAAQPPKNFPATTNIGEEKSVSNILYLALHETKSFSNNGVAVSPTGLNISAPQNININSEFQFTSLSTFEEGSSNWINPICYQALNAYDHYTGNLDPILDGSTITTVNDNPSTSYGQWPDPNTSSGLDLPNCWNWNEIDVSGDLNIAWDDGGDHNNAEIKP